MALDIDSVFRDNVVKGDIHSGAHEPDKPEIRALLKTISGAASNPSIVKQTKAALDLVTPASESYGGLVLNDPDPTKNGYYYRSGSAWVKGRGFPDSVALFEQSGGSVNALQLSVAAGVDPVEIVLGLLVPTGTNTGATTIAISGGGAVPLLSAAGAPLGPGELVGGKATILAKIEGDWRVILAYSQFTFRGAWSSVTNYVGDDIVESGGSLWLANRSNTNVTPIEGVDWALFLPGVTVADGSLTEPKYATGSVSRRALAADIAATADVLITVGTGGNYSTINAALTAASRIIHRDYKAKGFTVEVRLLTGFVMAEQVFVDNLDLGFIRLTSVDPVVYINPAALTQFLVAEENSRPAFGGTHGAVLPVIGVQFEFQAGGTESNHGLEVYWNSSCELLPGSGFRKSPGRGMSALYSSKLVCYPSRLTSSGTGDNPLTNRGVDCSQAATRALYVAFGSTASLARSNFDGSSASPNGNAAVYAIWNSSVDIYQSYVRNATRTAVEIRDMSICNARECEVSGAGEIGFHAYHQAHINARWLPTIGTSGADNCQIGVLCNHGSTIEAVQLPVRNCSVAGMSAARNSRISAELTFASGSPIGYLAAQGSVITAADSEAIGCSDAGYRAASGATISATAAKANNCGRGFETLSGGKVFAQSSSATGCTTRAVSALEGGEINVMSATLTGAGSEGVTARNGARVNAQNANARRGASDATSDFTVQSGGIINASGATGGTVVTANTIQAAGIIFK